MPLFAALLQVGCLFFNLPLDGSLMVDSNTH